MAAKYFSNPVFWILVFSWSFLAVECNTKIVPYNAESDCSDSQDNDGDGEVDCEDQDCSKACFVRVNFTDYPNDRVLEDSVTVSGEAQNATSVKVLNTTIGSSVNAELLNNQWEAKLINLASGLNEILAVAKNSTGASDSSTITITR